MKSFMGNSKKHKSKAKNNNKKDDDHADENNKNKHPKRCRALCCGSRISVSSSSSSGIKSSDTEQLDYLSNYAHGMVHARLEQMVDEDDTMYGLRRPRRRDLRLHEEDGGRCVILVAMETSSDDPKGDFQRSMMEVITLRRLREPKELRSLLNCYMSVNSREIRLVILEAFYEVCCSLFVCNSR